MPTPSSSSSFSTPTSAGDEYQRRILQLQQQRNKFDARDRIFIGTKVATGSLALGLAVWLSKFHTSQIAYILLPVLLLIALFAWHERTLEGLRANANLQAAYERGMARLEDRWFLPIEPGKTGKRLAATEDFGERFLSAEHPYARDLDLFGPGSLYQLLCTAATRIGKETLAEWLLRAAPLDEIVRRQAAVQELAPMLDFREQMVLAGAALADRVRKTGAVPEYLAAWSVLPAGVNARLRFPALLVAMLWVASVAGWLIVGGVEWDGVLVIVTIAARIFGSRSRSQVKQAAARIEAATGDIDVLARVLRVIEQQNFVSEKLSLLQAQVRSSGLAPSQALASLGKRIDWLSSADNWFVKILDGFLQWKLQCVIAIENWRRMHGTAVHLWLEAIGEIETLTAFSVYAYEHPEDAFPTFAEEAAACFDAEEFAHPLLPRGRAIRNRLKLDPKLQLMVISGPNMAGKSTFIRSVGVNAVLAQAGAPVRARSLRMSRLNIAASICVLDSLQGGLSRFYAEILRLKDIDALSRQEVPVLFLLDELLSGTNSHDRRVGTESIVRSLVGRNAIGLVTTHDLALAAIADGLGGRAANYHFEDRYEDGKLYFEYKLTRGIVQTSNALQLMRSIGLEV